MAFLWKKKVKKTWLRRARFTHAKLNLMFVRGHHQRIRAVDGQVMFTTTCSTT